LLEGDRGGGSLLQEVWPSVEMREREREREEEEEEEEEE
jgi:hypothetical protein